MFLAWLLVMLTSMAVNGFVLKILWAWFMVPLGLPNIGMMHAYGLTLMVSFLIMKNSDLKDQEYDSEELITLMIGGIVTGVLFLALGWIAHYFMWSH